MLKVHSCKKPDERLICIINNYNLLLEMTGITTHTTYFKYKEQRRKEPWGIRGICSDDDMPSKYAPDEIQNSMFLPLMKKALIGAEHRGQTPKIR